METKLREIIIEVAKLNGFKLPEYSNRIWNNKTTKLGDNDIKVNKAYTSWGKDLEEYWLSYPTSISVFVVKEGDIKQFIRDIKLKEIGI